MNGVCKWFDPTKGYGFIVGEDGREAFVHRTFVKTAGGLADNDTVTFDPRMTGKGLKAENVVIVKRGTTKPLKHVHD